MLKGDKFSTPYFNIINNSESICPLNSLKISQNVSLSSKDSQISTNGSNGINAAGIVANSQKVTRRVAHEICEKRKLEEQEFELSKRVKTEGDANEALIKQLVSDVEGDFTNNENDVSNLNKSSLSIGLDLQMKYLVIFVQCPCFS